MKSLITKLMIPALLTGVIVACSGGGGAGFAGIGGSGYISTGTVTGFGSVFVNGVEFDTRSAIFEVEDNSGSQQDLHIGMVVQVQGTINADGITGTATGIRYGDQLQGPIASIVENTIFGTTVVVTAADTTFRNVTYGSLLANYVVEVSGHYDNAGVLRASYIELKATGFDANTQFEISGSISGLSGTSFSLHGVNVNAVAANLSDLPNGLQDSIYVEVKGLYDSSTNTINATAVEAEQARLLDDGSEVSIEGYITRYTSPGDFDIDGNTVDASSASLEPATLALRAGIKVEAEGVIVNGVFIASKVETRGGDAEVAAYVDTIDSANKRFTVRVVSGRPSVTVQLTTATLTEDDVGSDEHLALSELVVGNYVEVRGFESGPATITATRVKRTDPADIELQGIVTNQQQDISITVLGVEFPVDAIEPGITEYLNVNEVPYANHAAFIDVVTPSTVVSIKDKKAPDGNDPGVADSVEIEIP